MSYIVRAREPGKPGPYPKTGDEYDTEAAAAARAREFAVQGWDVKVETQEESDAEDADSKQPSDVQGL